MQLAITTYTWVKPAHVLEVAWYGTRLLVPFSLSLNQGHAVYARERSRYTF